MKLQTYLKTRQNLINEAMMRYLPGSEKGPKPIHQAMRYSVLGEGKRIRPILALAACEAVGGKAKDALHAACALELIHAYSLVHDDLPSMDDDDFRRGKPSCHKKFGEAIGVLTGDALLTYAFELLASANHGSAVHLNVIREITKAIGTQGMIGGQVADITLGRAKSLSPKQIELINRQKTGALLGASVRVGALLGKPKPAAYQALKDYGQKIGLVFQLVDDLLDKDGAVKVQGARAVYRRAERLTQEAIDGLEPLGAKAQPLRDLAQFILTRDI